jgi:hypothetical protein
MQPSEQIRDYAYRHYVLPARAKKYPTVTFTSGPIHKALGFKSLMPCVCDALGTSKFQAEYRIRLVGRTGPKHGAAATFTFSV